MEWLRFQNICFSSDSSIGQLRENLKEIVRKGIYYDPFEIQNTKWFWFGSKMLTALENEKMWMFRICSSDSQ